MIDLASEIAIVKGKEDIARIAATINDTTKYAELVALLKHRDYHIKQWAAWVLGHIKGVHANMMIPHLQHLFNLMLEKGQPDAIKRNVLRILQTIDIPEDMQGPAMNICFDLLADPHEPVAIRAFSMTVLDNLSKTYPEIKQELHALIRNELEHSPTPGFKSRAKKILSK